MQCSVAGVWKKPSMVEKRTEKKSSEARARLYVCAQPHTSCTVVGGLHSELKMEMKNHKFDLVMFRKLSAGKVDFGLILSPQHFLTKIVKNLFQISL